MPNRVGRMVSKSLECVQYQPPSKTALAMSNDRMSEIKNSSFSGSNLLERPPWSTLSGGMLVLVVSAAAPGSDEI